MAWGNIKERYLELVTTLVNTPEANTTTIDVSNGNLYLRNGESAGIRTPDPLLAKPRIDFALYSI